MRGKGFQKFLAFTLAASMTVSLVPTVYADDGIDDEALISDLMSYAEDYPNGGFTFRESQIEAYEDSGSTYVDVVRMGSFEGEASVSLNAVDISAVYGKDYTMSVDDGWLLEHELSQDNDAVPLMELYAQTSEEAVIGEEQKEETPDNTVEMMVDANEGIVNVEETSAEGDAEESTGLRAAREVFTGEKSDRKTWQESDVRDNPEAQALAEEVEKSGGYTSDMARELPGTKCTLDFADGEYIKRVKINLVNDTLSESDEQVMFALYDEQGAELAKPYTAYINILDDDQSERVVFSMPEESVTVTPDDEYAEVTVERISGIDKFASVRIATGDIDAVPDKDYKAGSVEVVFPQGVAARKVKIPVYQNGRKDPVSFVAAIDTDSAFADEETRATAITILPDYSEESMQDYYELLTAQRRAEEAEKSAAEADEETDEEADNDPGTYTEVYYIGQGRPDGDVSLASIEKEETDLSGKYVNNADGTDYTDYSTVIKDLDLRNAISITVNYEAHGLYTYENKYTVKDGCHSHEETKDTTCSGQMAQFLVGGNQNQATNSAEIKAISGSETASGSTTIKNFDKKNFDKDALQIRVRKTEKPDGGTLLKETISTVYIKVVSVVVEYEEIEITVDNDDAETNTYQEIIYEAGHPDVDTNNNINYTNGNTIYLGQGTVDNDGKYLKYSSGMTLSAISPTASKTRITETSAGMSVTFGQNVYLAGWQVKGKDNKYSDTISTNELTLEYLYSKYKNDKHEYTIRPVFKPYASVVRFNNSCAGELAYTNNISDGKEIGLTMLDTLRVQGVSVNGSGKVVKSFSVSGYKDNDVRSSVTQANTRVSESTGTDGARTKYLDAHTNGRDKVSADTSTADTSQITIKPDCDAIYVDMASDTILIDVRYNPADSAPREFEDKGSVFYIDTSDIKPGTNPDEDISSGTDDIRSVYGRYDTPMTIRPRNFTDIININAVYGKVDIDNPDENADQISDDTIDPDENADQISEYTTVWQDFTGDENGDGKLDQEEVKKLADKYTDRDRDAVTGDVFSYLPKVVHSSIYYYFKERSIAESPGTIMGIVALKDHPVFSMGKANETTITPLNGATVTVDGLTAVTTNNAAHGGMDGRGGDGYFEINDKSFVAGESHRLTVTNKSLSTAAAHNVNISQTYILDAYDTISIGNATIEKNNKQLDFAAGDTVSNDDASYKITLATQSSNSSIIAKKATLKFYRRDGSPITEKTYDSTGDNTGVFACTFNPVDIDGEGTQLPPGTTATVTFTDNYGTMYYEHDMGFTIMQSLGGTKTIITEFAFGDGSTALELLGAVLSKLTYGWDGSLDVTGSGGDDYSKYTVTGSDPRVLNVGISFDGESPLKTLKEFGENDSASEGESEAVRGATGTGEDGKGNNSTSAELVGNYSASFNFGITLTMSPSKDANHLGEWCFDEFMIVIAPGITLNATMYIMTPIGLPVIIGGSVGVSGQAIIVVEKQHGAGEFYITDLLNNENGANEEGKRYMHTYGHLIISPTLTLTAGIGTKQLNVTLSGTAAFELNIHCDDKISSNGYVTFSGKLGLKIWIFKFSWSLGSTGKISLGGSSEADLTSLLDLDSALDGSPPDFSVSEREYLANRTPWNGDGISLTAVSNLEEKQLMDGVNPNTDTQLVDIGNGRYLSVYVDDVPERTDSNSMAVYYTIYDEGSWSEPVILEDDGTLDDSPAVYDLGNGKVFIAWSTANEEYGDDPDVIDTLNSANIHGIFFDKESASLSGNVIEITKNTDEDIYNDTEAQIAYDEETGKMLIYYTKSEYDETDVNGDEVETAYEGAANPYSLIVYRIYDTKTNEFLGYSEEEESAIKANLAAEGETDIDAAYAKYAEDYYNQRFLDLAPRVIVNEELDGRGYWTETPEITEYTGNTDPLIIENDAIAYNGLALFAYVLDYDGNRDTTNDRDVFLQIYNFSEDSVTHPIMLTSNEAEESKLHFERIGGAVTYLSYLSDGAVKMFDIPGNISDENVLTKAETESGVPYYYLNKTNMGADEDGYVKGYTPPVTVVGPDTSGDYTGEMQITDFDLRSSDDYFYIMFTESKSDLKEGIDQDSNEAKDPANTMVETQIYMTRYDIKNGILTYPVQVTEDEGANYANIAFAVKDNDGGFVALATRSESSTEKTEENENSYSSVNTDNSALYSISFTPDASVEIRNAHINDISSDAYVGASFEVYNGGIDTIDGLTVEITDSKGNEYEPDYGTDPDNKERDSVSLVGGHYYRFNFGIPVSEAESDAGFTAVVKDKDGQVLDTVEYSNLANRYIEVTSFSAEIKERGVIEFDAIAANRTSVISEEEQFVIKKGGEVIYSADIDPIDPGEYVEISDEIEVDYDTFFESVVNEDGSITADTELTASASGGNRSDTVSLSATSEQMARMNAVSDVTFAGSSFEIPVGEGISIGANIKANEYNGRFEDNNTEETGALGVEFTYLSADENIAKVYPGGYIVGVSEGTTTVTAMLMPARSVYNDNSYQSNYPTMPNEAIKTYTFDVKVTAANPPSPGGGTSGGAHASSRQNPAPTTAPTATAAPTAEPTAQPVENPAMSPSAPQNKLFDDVAAGDWFYDAVKYVSDNGIMVGVSDNSFAPNTNVTRAMFATILYRISGETAESYRAFDDIGADAWYGDAVAWCAANGIVNGVSDTKFAPDEIITREQMCAMLKRYMDYKSVVFENTNEGIEFNDADQISDYAAEAVNELTRCGIINGFDTGSFMPSNGATRAECATVIMKFMNMEVSHNAG